MTITILYTFRGRRGGGGGGVEAGLWTKTSAIRFTVIPNTPTITVKRTGKVQGKTSFTLTCETSTALTNPTYVWYIDDVAQDPQSSGTLSQTSSVREAKKYTCKVSGDGGQHFSEISGSYGSQGKLGFCVDPLGVSEGVVA